MLFSVIGPLLARTKFCSYLLQLLSLLSRGCTIPARTANFTVDTILPISPISVILANSRENESSDVSFMACTSINMTLSALAG